jgi:F-type H+-transporting ATPase subunit delta
MLLEKVYADALASYAAEKGITSVMLNEFGVFIALYRENPVLREFLENPSISTAKKMSAVKRIMKDGFRDDFAAFIEILISKQRQRILPAIYDEFTRLTNKLAGAIEIEIRTAFQLSAGQIEDIRAKFAKMYDNPEIIARIVLSPELIGGFEVRVGDSVYDYSISGRIVQMAGKLLKKEEQDEHQT